MTMEDFKRPNHPDFCDSSELRKQEFTGIRHNSITNDMEIWILGNCERRISELDMKLNINAANEAFAEVMGLNKAGLEVAPDHPGLRKFRGD